ncbi:hypothetical protein BT96DRAFT_990893 [Gymnopus androsaceus JB14]|uniref:Uncharacterized protein n=1 Tax=Gymnopus androsaceus JB14 TaxID=1447944 RepID=A0A6A4HZN5_9AGAR|nr:hypothetical protein BT96DRAFT_990893 [Gymnopus androsaceus JB14]
MGFVNRDPDSRNVLYHDKEFRIIDLEDILLDFTAAPAYFQKDTNDDIYDTLICQARDTLEFWDNGTVFPDPSSPHANSQNVIDIVHVRDFKFKKDPYIPTERLMASLFPMFMVYYYTRGIELKNMVEDYFRRIQTLVKQG